MGKKTGKGHTWPKGLHNSVDVLRFHTVDDVVAGTRDEVTAGHDFNFGLARLSKSAPLKI